MMKYKKPNQKKSNNSKIMSGWDIAYLLKEFYLPIMFQEYTLHTLSYGPGKKIKYGNNKGQQLQNKDRGSYGSYAPHANSMRSIHLWSFMIIPCIHFELYSEQNSKYEKNKGQ